MTTTAKKMYIEYTVWSNEHPDIFQKKIKNVLDEFAVYHPCNLTNTYMVYHYFILYWTFTNPCMIKFTQTYYVDKRYNDPGFDMALRNELYVLQDTLESVGCFMHVVNTNITDNTSSSSRHHMEKEMFECYELDQILNDLGSMNIK